MQNMSISKQIEALPPEAQRLVLDLVLLLSSQPHPSARRKTKRVPLSKEKFIGMWKDRADMADSATYVRNLRRSEWSFVATAPVSSARNA